jgi:hypothetical protein
MIKNVECLVNNKLERMWKEAAVAYVRYYPRTCLNRLRKNSKTIMKPVFKAKV